MSATSTALTQSCRCRYYGKSHAALKAHGVLLDQHGNECAVVLNTYAGCKMEELGYPPDEEKCPRSQRYHQDHQPAPKGSQW